jgi:hypothetical protein
MTGRTTSQGTFLLDQPFWAAQGEDPDERWDLAVREEEPESRGLASAHRPAPQEGTEQRTVEWKRI